MKYLNTLYIFSLFCLSITFGQTPVNQIDASLTKVGNEVTVLFTPNNTFQNTGEASSLKVWLKLPASNTSAVNLNFIDNPFNLALIGPSNGSVSGSDRIFQYQVTFGTGLQYNTWSIGSAVSIATFSITGYTGPTLEVGLATFGFSGSSWNGTSINRVVAGNFTNLVVWPITSTVILPIKMKSFSAIKDGERASRLDWVTSSEVNSDYFGVERSADGNTWEQIGQVAAAGNSNTDIAYQFLDRKLPSFRAGENIFYYRLRLTDLDGQYKYSDVRGVNFGKLSNSIISIYPNPTTEIINVDISGMSLDAGDVTLSVFDMNGRNMLTKNIIGNGIELIEVDQYPSGTYNVVVQQGETIQQKKIIKID